MILQTIDLKHFFNATLDSFPFSYQALPRQTMHRPLSGQFPDQKGQTRRGVLSPLKSMATSKILMMINWYSPPGSSDTAHSNRQRVPRWTVAVSPVAEGDSHNYRRRNRPRRIDRQTIILCNRQTKETEPLL